MLNDLEETLAISGDGLDVQAKARLTRAKVGAQKSLETARALVMPEDDEGG